MLRFLSLQLNLAEHDADPCSVIKLQLSTSAVAKYSGLETKFKQDIENLRFETIVTST